MVRKVQKRQIHHPGLIVLRRCRIRGRQCIGEAGEAAIVQCVVCGKLTVLKGEERIEISRAIHFDGYSNVAKHGEKVCGVGGLVPWDALDHVRANRRRESVHVKYALLTRLPGQNPSSHVNLGKR